MSRSIVSLTVVPAWAATISDCEPGISAPRPRAYEYTPGTPVIEEFMLNSIPEAPNPSLRTKPTREETRFPEGYSRT